MLTNILLGEATCINCGRVVGEAIAGQVANTICLRPARHQSELQVELVNGRSLRCKRCRGRAFIERVLPRDDAPDTTGVRSDRRLAGAA